MRFWEVRQNAARYDSSKSSESTFITLIARRQRKQRAGFNAFPVSRAAEGGQYAGLIEK